MLKAGEMELRRVGAATPGEPPIIGTWKPVTTRSLAAPSQMSPEAKRAMKMMVKNATYTYTTAGVLKLRIPLLWMNGSYDLAEHTFTLTDPRTSKVHSGQFQLRDGKLYLSQPDGNSTDEYLRDDQ